MVNTLKDAFCPSLTRVKTTASVPTRRVRSGAVQKLMRMGTTLKVAGRRVTPPGAGVARTAPPAGQRLAPTADFHFNIFGGTILGHFLPAQFMILEMEGPGVLQNPVTQSASVLTVAQVFARPSLKPSLDVP